jgi:anti-anti-sigma factor
MFSPPSHSSVEVAVLPLAGDLDVSNVDAASRAIRLAESRRPGVLVLDLRRVTFIDSTMLRVILSAHARGVRQGRRLVVAVGTDAVRRLFRTTLLEWRLEIVDDPAGVVAGPDPVAARHGR